MIWLIRCLFVLNCLFPLQNILGHSIDTHGRESYQDDYLEIIGQLTLVKLPATHDVRTFNEVVKWLGKSHVGNVLICKVNMGEGSLCEQAERVACLSETIYRKTGLVPFKAADQEGGRVQNVIGTRIPNPMNMRSDEIEIFGNILAIETKAVGINLCLGPVLDISFEENFIGNRSFGCDPDTVIDRAKIWLRTLKAHGLLVTGKHFPGHGSTLHDTHRDAAYVEKTKEELLSWDIRPFLELSSELDAIMSSHVFYPSLDNSQIGTYSPAIMTDLLSEFKGMRVTDSLGMLAATPIQTTFDQTALAMAANAIKAIKAGCDLVILGIPQFGDYVPEPKENMKLINRIMEHMANSLRQGEISPERLQEALMRVQAAKDKIATPSEQTKISKRFAEFYQGLYNKPGYSHTCTHKFVL